MRLLFVTKNKEFADLAASNGYDVHSIDISDYIPSRSTVFVSPANSLGFMDGGIDIPLSTCIFPGIDIELRKSIQTFGRTSQIRRKYFPVGSAMFLPQMSPVSKHIMGMISAPTMLRPQNIQGTVNVLRATQAVRVLGTRLNWGNDVDVVFTSMGCGYGRLDAETSLEQIIQGWESYQEYPETDDSDEKSIENTLFVHRSFVSPQHQPDTYENSEFFTTPDKKQTTHWNNMLDGGPGTYPDPLTGLFEKFNPI